MGKNSAIEWTDHTFNAWIGCEKVSPGCKNCYAARYGKRYSVGWGEPYRRTAESNWRLPLAWNRAAERVRKLWAQRGAVGAPPARPRVFTASLADWLDEAAPAEWLADLLDVVSDTPELDWLLLTKRPELWRSRLEAVIALAPGHDVPTPGIELARTWLGGEAPSNVWLGTTTEDQQRADERIPVLLSIPARVRFLSCEPLLGPVDLKLSRSTPRIEWIIAGGESDDRGRARPMHPAWARSLRDQAQACGVPFFFKQWGDWRPRLATIAGAPEPVCRGDAWGTMQAAGEFFPATTPWNGREDGDSIDDGEVVLASVGKKAAGRVLDGRTWDELPTVRR